MVRRLLAAIAVLFGLWVVLFAFMRLASRATRPG